MAYQVFRRTVDAKSLNSRKTLEKVTKSSPKEAVQASSLYNVPSCSLHLATCWSPTSRSPMRFKMLYTEHCITAHCCNYFNFCTHHSQDTPNHIILTSQATRVVLISAYFQFPFIDIPATVAPLKV